MKNTKVLTQIPLDPRKGKGRIVLRIIRFKRKRGREMNAESRFRDDVFLLTCLILLAALTGCRKTPKPIEHPEQQRPIEQPESQTESIDTEVRLSRNEITRRLFGNPDSPVYQKPPAAEPNSNSPEKEYHDKLLFYPLHTPESRQIPDPLREPSGDSK